MRLKIPLAGLALAATFVVCGGASVSAQSPAPVSSNVVVQPGDTLTKIANAHATTYTRLYDANTQISHPDVIHPGENIRIPAPEEQIPSRPLPAPPQPQPARYSAAPQRGQYRAAAPASAPAAGVWGQLAACESGGNPATNTGNGYYGAYQFTASTWRSVGGSGLPSEASMEEQTARAQALQARSGWGQWPACTAKLGLR